MLEETAPARLVLLRPFADAKTLSITLVSHPDRYQQRHVADLARPAALEHEAVQVNIGVFALDRPVAPGLDRSVNLLVQIRHRRGRHSRTPQSLGDIFHAAHRDSS